MPEPDPPPRPGWTPSDLTDVHRGAWAKLAHQLRADLQYRHTTLMASGIAFRAFLALFSTLVVASSALVLAQPAGEIIHQTRRVTLGLPSSAREVLVKQVETIVLADDTELRVTFVIALLLAMWVASSTIHGVMDALTAVNAAVEDRSWLRRRLTAIGLTLGSLAFVVVSLVFITGLPVVFGGVGIERGATVLAVLAELAALSFMMFTALLVIYHYGPARPLPSWRWTWPGAVVGTLAWLLGTEGFAQAVEHFGTYNFRYGTVAGIVVLMLWLLLTSWCVLFGATLNARLARRNPAGRSVTDDVLETAITEAHDDRAVSRPPRR